MTVRAVGFPTAFRLPQFLQWRIIEIMIYALQGRASERREGFFVFQAGDVFYKIFAGERTLQELPRANGEMKIFCSPYIRDESVPELYGFLDEQSLRFFELLIGVSGVGRKTALRVLDGGTVEEISAAIAEGKASLFSRTPGIGKKTAERIILELREKMHLTGSEAIASRMEVDVEVLDVLAGLGFSRDKVRGALKEMGEEPKQFEERLKKALKEVSK